MTMTDEDDDAVVVVVTWGDGVIQMVPMVPWVRIVRWEACIIDIEAQITGTGHCGADVGRGVEKGRGGQRYYYV